MNCYVIKKNVNFYDTLKFKSHLGNHLTTKKFYIHNVSKLIFFKRI